MARHELGLRVGLGEQLLDPGAVVAFEWAVQPDLEQVERVGERLALGERTPADEASARR